MAMGRWCVAIVAGGRLAQGCRGLVVGFVGELGCGWAPGNPVAARAVHSWAWQMMGRLEMAYLVHGLGRCLGVAGLEAQPWTSSGAVDRHSIGSAPVTPLSFRAEPKDER